MARWWKKRDATGRRALDSSGADAQPVDLDPAADLPDPAEEARTEIDHQIADELDDAPLSPVDDDTAGVESTAETDPDALPADEPVDLSNPLDDAFIDALVREALADDTPFAVASGEQPAEVADEIEPPVEVEHVHVLTPWPPRPVGLHRPRRSTAAEKPQPTQSHALAEIWPTYPWNEPELPPQSLRKEPTTMSALSKAINDLLAIEGATGAAIVDYESGMALASGGDPGFNLDVAAAGNSNVVRAKLSTMNEIGLKDEINDILITLGGQYHLINVLADDDQRGLFIYLVLNKANSNLALARHKLTAIARSVTV